MLQNFKKFLPWIIILGLTIYIFIQRKEIESLKVTETESTIETKVYTEESLIDSLFIMRDSIQETREFTFLRIDSLGLEDLANQLKLNLNLYETGNY